MLRNRPFVLVLCWALNLVTPSGLTQAKDILPGNVNPQMGARQGQPMISAKAILVKARKIYYENTIKGIIRADCGRCHSGPTRNLVEYDSLKAYADSGLLGAMVQGPMRRFAGNDVQVILKWIQDGAPEKPAAASQVQFSQIPRFNSPVCRGPGSRAETPLTGVPNGQITYHNTIKHILAKDCLRCHSGPFRNLATYKNVKMYVANGLLKTLVLPGGPMHRFAGPDTRQILAWVNDGAPP